MAQCFEGLSRPDRTRIHRIWAVCVHVLHVTDDQQSSCSQLWACWTSEGGAELTIGVLWPGRRLGDGQDPC